VGAAGLTLVLVDLREEADVVGPWLAARELGGETVILDRFGAIAKAFGVERRSGGKSEATLPRTVVIDAAGRVVAIFGHEGADYVPRVLGALAREGQE